MAQAVIRTFDQFGAAQQAREALLSAGFAGRVELSVRADEAGPVEGNFLAGNGRTDPAGDPDVHQPLTAAGDDIYHRNFANVVHRGLHMLVVQAEDAADAERASAILDRYGAIDIERVSARNGGTG